MFVVTADGGNSCCKNSNDVVNDGKDNVYGGCVVEFANLIQPGTNLRRVSMRSFLH